MSASSDRNLLFGLIALKMDFVTREGLLDAMSAWLDRKADPLGVILQERGALGEEDCRAVEALLARHLIRHDGDAQKSLAGLHVETPLRERLSLLADADVRASLLSLTPDTAGDAPPLPLPPPLPSGNGASRYRKVRFHAKGGLGEVSVALDEELGREVALKEIQDQHADRGDFRARFVREAEITGNLEHPSIVPVYGLGAQIDGRPYYAMRFIRGESMQEAITRFHRDDEGRRDPGEREMALRGLLARFVAVCNAVAYAHSRGVVHRDLKPANVMLGEYGETLVVDWGLAKVLDLPDDATAVARPVTTTGGGATPTVFGQAVGTPAYMPPEQARGQLDEVDHRSDVFALGATLYCLLTGRPPYERGGVSLLGAAAACDHPPARRVNKRVPAALEAVCARAMAAGPEDRYGGARQLAADVERFLADEPVTAMPDPLSEKARRWAKRNRTLVTSGVVLLLAGVVGLGVGLSAVRAEQGRTREALGVAEGRREQAESNLARAERAEADAKGNLKRSEENLKLAKEAVDGCYRVVADSPLFDAPVLSQEAHELKRLLLVQALPFYQRLRERQPGDRDADRDVWEQHVRVGLIQRHLGSLPDASASYRQAEQAGRALVKAHPDVLSYQENLARTLNDLGAVRHSLSQLAEAHQNFTEAVQLLRSLAKAQPGVLGHQSLLATTLAHLADTQFHLRRFDDALVTYAEAIKAHRAMFQSRPDVPEVRSRLASALTNLSLLEVELGQTKEAARNCSEAAELFRTVVKDRPAVTYFRGRLAGCLSTMGKIQIDLGQPQEAAKSCSEAAELFRALVRAQPGVPDYQRGLGRSLHILGHAHLLSNQLEDAHKNCAEAAGLFRALSKAQPNWLEVHNDLAVNLPVLGRIQSALNRPKEALESFQEAAELRRALIRIQPDATRHRIELAQAIYSGAAMQAALRQPADALAGYTEAAALSRAVLQAQPGATEPRLQIGYTLLGQAAVLRRQRRFEEARRALDEALTALGGLKSDWRYQAELDRIRRLVHETRGLALADSGKFRDALRDWDKAIPLAPPNVHLGMRMVRADWLARAGEHGRAAAEALEISRLPGVTPNDGYNLACVLALSAAAARNDPRQPLPVGEGLAEARGRAAVALLRRAAKGGFFSTAGPVEHMHKDADLDFLRDRPDFRAFVASLTRPK